MTPFRLIRCALLLLSSAACVPPPTSAPTPPMGEMMQPGISLALATARAAAISEVRYDLALDLTGADLAPGTLALSFRRAEGAGDLVVDFRGLTLDSVAANGAEVRAYRWENGHILIPARHLQAGENELRFRFTAGIAAAGASIIRFEDPSDGATYLYTLLVPADANQLFPSFDQPDLKGVFRMTLTAPVGWKVLANGPLEDTVREGGAVRWSFAPTKPISTYLAAFAAGPWATWDSAPEGERPITVYARRSRAAHVDVDSLVQAHREALGWLEQYFGIGYPFAKLDFLLAPAFPFGGMEHPGAIFYNENQFVFDEPPTMPQRLSRLNTLYHEVAHQWFGDLVTMRWFDDLWLKEGFSNYMAAQMQEELQAGTGAWKTFYLRNKPLAYAVDVTSGTTPVWQELPNLDLAKSNYGPIVYNKAPSILKQLDYLVGDDFSAGVRLFLTRHAYGNATWQDLLAALEEASGQSLEAFGEQYIQRAGAPVVETQLRAADGKIRELSLVQRPARRLEGDRGGWWPMKVRVRLGYADREDVVLSVFLQEETTVVTEAAGLPLPDYVFPNDEDYGYGIFLLDPWSARYLQERVGTISDPLQRAMAWGALWDLVREARLDPERYVELALRELPSARDEQIASTLQSHVRTALTRYVPAEEAARLRPRAERVLLSRVEDEELSVGARKASLDALIAIAQTSEARAVLRDYLAETRTFAGDRLPQPSRWAVVQTLLATADPEAERLFAAEQARDTTPDAERHAFVAGAARPDPEAKARYFMRYLDDPGLNEDWVTASLGAFHYPDHEALTLRFLRPALERLEWIRENRRIFFLPRWIGAFVAGRSSPEALQEVDRYLLERPELPLDLRRKVLQARDELERTLTVRGR